MRVSGVSTVQWPAVPDFVAKHSVVPTRSTYAARPAYANRQRGTWLLFDEPLRERARSLGTGRRTLRQHARGAPLRRELAVSEATLLLVEQRERLRRAPPVERPLHRGQTVGLLTEARLARFQRLFGALSETRSCGVRVFRECSHGGL